jgi:hypothetical protein
LKMQMKPPKQTSHGWEFKPTDTNNVLINVILSLLSIFNYFDQVYVLIRKLFFSLIKQFIFTINFYLILNYNYYIKKLFTCVGIGIGILS